MLSTYIVEVGEPLATFVDAPHSKPRTDPPLPRPALIRNSRLRIGPPMCNHKLHTWGAARSPEW